MVTYINLQKHTTLWEAWKIRIRIFINDISENWLILNCHKQELRKMESMIRPVADDIDKTSLNSNRTGVVNDNAQHILY